MDELLKQLTAQLGVSPDQAKSGAGLIFKLAKENLGADFSEVESVVDRVGDLIDAAPDEGMAAGLLGGLASAVGGDKMGDLGRLVAGFKKLGIDPDQLGNFGDVILGFLKDQEASDITALIQKFLR